MSRARSISWRRTSVMFARMSGRSIFGFRIEPRSPPVQVATCTSTPSATYLAVDAAPLLDSSSGWACTCISRWPARGWCGHARESRSARVDGTMERMTEHDTLAERYGAPSPRRRARRDRRLGRARRGVPGLAGLDRAGPRRPRGRARTWSPSRIVGRARRDRARSTSGSTTTTSRRPAVLRALRRGPHGRRRAVLRGRRGRRWTADRPSSGRSAPSAGRPASSWSAAPRPTSSAPAERSARTCDLARWLIRWTFCPSGRGRPRTTS